MRTQTIYLDHAAATPLDERVFAAMRPYLTEQFYNPSSAYQASRAVRQALDEARHRLAKVIGAQKDEIILTAGATESINLAIHGVMAGRKAGIVIGATEHPAVRAAAESYQCRIAGADSRGIISEQSVREQINDQTCLVSITMADSELGVVQPIKQIAALIAGIRDDRRRRGVDMPLYLHSDGSQALGQLDVHVARLGVDLLSLNASKCYGPKQTGLLWVKSGLVLEPLIRGGGQERGLRAGTEAVANAVGFALGAERAEAGRHAETHRLRELRDALQVGLQARVPDLEVDGHAKRRLPGHLHVSLNGLDAERVVFALDELGIMTATGAACAANKGTRSVALQAIGMDDAQADGSLRLSLGRLNDMDQITVVADKIATVILRERDL